MARRIIAFFTVFAMLISFSPCALAMDVTQIPDYRELRDPCKITDEAFFGVYANGEWTTAPTLRYDDFTALSSVKAAAQSGDYAAAKAALLAYYKARTEIPAYTVTPQSTIDLASTLSLEQIVGNMTPVTTFTVAAAADSWIEIPMPDTSEISPAFMIFDRNKSDNALEIYTKEGGKAPYITTTVNGTDYTLSCTADTYFRAGDYKNTCYGSAARMYVREKQIPLGNDTERAYLNFDISPLPDSGARSAVVLHLYVSAGSAKEIVIYKAPNQIDMDENTAIWATHTPGTFNYKGGIFDFSQPEGVEFEWINKLGRLERNTYMAQYYAQSHDEAYAFRAIANLIDLYTYQVADYPRPLDTAWRTPALLATIFGFIDSSQMNSETFTTLIKCACATGETLRDATHGVVNQRHAIRVGFLRMVMYFPEVFPATYKELAIEKLMKVYNNDVLNSDGTYREGTTGYMSGVCEEILEVIDLFKKTQGSCDERIIEVCRTLGHYIANFTQPDGRLVPYGDGGRVETRPLLALIAEATNDAELLAHSSAFKSGKTPDYTSVFYPYKKIAMMRSDWKKIALYATISAEVGGQHSHPDDLHLDVYAYNAPLLMDSGNGGGYNDTSPAAYVRDQTWPHNTVEVDSTPQALTGTSGMEFSTNKLFDYVNAYTDSNASVRHRRKVLFVRDMGWFVTDILTPSDTAVHTYKQNWHPDNSNALTVDSVTKAAVTHFPSNKPNLYIVPSKTTDSATVSQSYMRSRTLDNILENYVYYTKEQSGIAVYNTLLYPTPSGTTPSVTNTALALSDGASDTLASASLATIDGAQCVYYASNEPTPARRSFDIYQTSAAMFFAKKSGAATTMLAATESRSVSDGTRALFSAAERIPAIGIEWKDTTLIVEAEKDFSQQVRIYAPLAESVLLNGEEINYIRYGDFVDINAQKLAFTPDSDNTVTSEGASLLFPVTVDGETRSGSLMIESGTVITGYAGWDGSIAISATQSGSLEVLFGDETKPITFSKPVVLKIPFYRADNGAYFINGTEYAYGENAVSAAQEDNLCVITTPTTARFVLHPRGNAVSESFDVKNPVDTHIRRSSSYKTINYGAVSPLSVNSSAYSSGNCRMAFLRFKYGRGVGESVSDIQNAKKVTLTLTVHTAPNTAGKLLLYGLYDDYVSDDTYLKAKTGWEADEITGSDASTWGLHLFEENLSQYAVVGGEAKGTQVVFDVTDYAKTQSDGILAFKLYAQSDSSTALSAALYSNEVATESYRPYLTVTSAEKEEPEAPEPSLEILPTDDCQIRRSSTTKDTNYADATSMYIHSSLYSVATCRQSYIKFALNADAVKNAKRVTLELTLRKMESGSGAGNILIYPLTDGYLYDNITYNCKSNWTESTLTGSSAVDFGLLFFEDNPITYSVDAQTEAKTRIVVDVTDYVKSQPDGVYAFKLWAQATDVDPVFLSLCTKESDYAPVLRVTNYDDKKIVFTKEGDLLCASVMLKASQVGENTALVTASYDAFGKLIGARIFKRYSEENGVATFSETVNMSDGTIKTVRAFLWNTAALSPLCESKEYTRD